MKSNIELITPAKAQQYLATITSPDQQRKHSDTISDQYARSMKAGHWMTTHQGIAFDEDGLMIDGQHRCWAIVKCGLPQRMLVTRGVEKSIEIQTGNHSSELFGIDCIDRGKLRTVGQQLRLRHGSKDGNFVAACCRSIMVLATKERRIPNTVPMALSVMDLFANEIEYVETNVVRTSGFRSGALNSVLALYIAAYPEKGKEFHSQVMDGENLRKTFPAYTLRDYLNKGKAYVGAAGGGGDLQYMISRASALSAMHHYKGNTVGALKSSDMGLEWILAANKAKVEKLRNLVNKA